ncbi:MAG: cystathionine gamma-synthase family protein [Janthinobacterium lividum]
MLRNKGLSTRALWAGEDEAHPYGAAQMPLVPAISFGYDTVDEWKDVALGRAPGHIYSRNTNPTLAVLEEKVRALEDAEAAISFSCGMAAISNTLYALVRPGERVVSVTDTYGGTNRIFTEFLPRIGVEVVLIPTHDEAAILAETAKGCAVLYLETPTNPTLKVLDLRKLGLAGRAAGAIVITDNTVATPINQNPLALGSDLVVHSASKFLCGHGDALGGILCGKQELVRTVFQYREINGAVLDPFAAYLIARGLKTLALRVERHNSNAMSVASFLESHPAVESVFYPGLKSHPMHEVAASQMRGFGGMMSFSLRENRSVDVVLQRLHLAHRAASLGHVETFAGVPATTSHVECTAEQRAAMGIPERLIRYSVGIENIEDIIDDLTQALEG